MTRRILTLLAAMLLALGMIVGPAIARPGNSAEKANTDGFQWLDGNDDPIDAPEGFEKAVLLANGNLVAFSVQAETEHGKGANPKDRVRPAKGGVLQERAAGGDFTVDVQCVEIDGNEAKFGGPVTESTNPNVNAGDWWRARAVEDDIDGYVGQRTASADNKNCAWATTFGNAPNDVTDGRIKVFSSDS